MAKKGNGKQKRGQGKAQSLLRQNLKIDEPSRIQITQALQNFRASNDQVYTFEANLSKSERALVHQLSLKMGMKSKSSGKSKNRRVSVFKTKMKVDTDSGLDSLPHFSFSGEAQETLGDLFTHYPPGYGDSWEQMVGYYNYRTDKPKQMRDDTFKRPSISSADIRKKFEAYTNKKNRDPHLMKINTIRSKLPIAAYEDAIISAVKSNQVVLVCGETGCGKTTQVPQFILDDMWGKGEACKIVCTQPRRISAISVSERIASERGEIIGGHIGYKIRLESKGGRQSSIVLCTTGILLRLLVLSSKASSRSRTKTMKYDDLEVQQQIKPFSTRRDQLDDNIEITHIIMDEIHERDRYSDFMMAIIRDMLPSYPHLRLILMSATVDAQRFSQYFGGCPIIVVPGFTHPVRTFYLEDVLSIVKSNKDNHLGNTKSNKDNHLNNDDHEFSVEDKLCLDEAIDLAWSNDDWDPLLELISSKGSPEIFDYQHSLTGFTPLMVFAGKGRVGDLCMLLSIGADCQLKARDERTALDIAEQENQLEAAEILKNHMGNASSNSKEGETLLDKYLARVNPEIVDVVLIEQLIRKICTDSESGGILVFLPGWDEINKTRDKLLQSPFFSDSKFSIICLHSMIPSTEQKKVFLRPSPGCRKIVLSTNIAETAVTIDDIVYVIDTGRMKEKSYDPYCNVSTLQSSWVSKASAKQREGRAGRCQPGICYHLYSSVRAASLPDFQVPEIKRMPIEELCLQVKMIDPSCKVEEFLLKTLDPPVFESIRNAILALQDIGALSRDEKLTLLGEKLGSLPVHPFTSKMLFLAILMKCLDPALTLACASDYKDPFIIPMLPDDKKKAAAARLELASLYGGCGDQLAVIAAFECWQNARTKGLEKKFCSQYFVSPGTMFMLSGMRRQLQNELIRNGFLREDVAEYNQNAHCPGILHAILVAGLYPMVGTLSMLKGGSRVIVETGGGDKVRLNHHSVSCKFLFKKGVRRHLVVFDEITRVDGGMKTRNCTLVAPLPLLLLSTEIAVAPGKDNANDNHTDTEENDGEGGDFDGEGEDAMELDKKSSEHCEDKKFNDQPEDKKSSEHCEDKMSNDQPEDKKSSEHCEDEMCNDQPEDKKSSEHFEDKMCNDQPEDKKSSEHFEDKMSIDQSEDKKSSEHFEDKMSIDQPEDKKSSNLMSSADNAVTVIMDRWLYFSSKALDVAQLYCLRERLSAAILYKVTYPGDPLPPTLANSIHAIISILSSDGLSGMVQISDAESKQNACSNSTNSQPVAPVPVPVSTEYVNRPVARAMAKAKALARAQAQANKRKQKKNARINQLVKSS